MVYSSLALVFFLGVASLAVDFGRVQTIKQDLQRSADATAMAAMNAYAESGYSVSAASTAAYTMILQNPVDAGSGKTPTATLVAGTWNRTTRTFSTAFAPGLPAVSVRMSRTAANNNAVPLTFGKAVGMAAVDTAATAIAVLVDNAATNVTVPGVANLFLAGLPAGTSSPWGDTYANAAPYQMSGIAVVPGTWVTVTNTGGLTNILPGTLGNYGPNGEAGRPLHHGENQDHTNWNIGPENGMADAIIPAAGDCRLDRPDDQRSAELFEHSRASAVPHRRRPDQRRNGEAVPGSARRDAPVSLGLGRRRAVEQLRLVHGDDQPQAVRATGEVIPVA